MVPTSASLNNKFIHEDFIQDFNLIDKNQQKRSPQIYHNE